MMRSQEHRKSFARLLGVPKPTTRHVPLALLLVLSVTLVSGAKLGAQETSLDSTFVFREIHLPPGIPSVALRTDETSMLCNPAGVGMSRTYYLGYAWKGTYSGDDLKVTSQFFLAKSRGFGLGIMRDSRSKERKNTYLLTIAPPVSSRLALGFTGKWRSGFNFDCGAMAAVGRHFTIGLVGRNLRGKSDARRYLEGGIALMLLKRKVTLFLDVINEDSKWQKATAYGGGLVAQLTNVVGASIAYFVDTNDVGLLRTTLRIYLSPNSVEGEYSSFSDNWSVIGARIASHSP